ncbi:MAG: methyltransferase domain-containing protein [Desulfobacterales bacterium]|nr:methyltransferase domain-containing protein [Desulfobacterales bacterium]
MNQDSLADVTMVLTWQSHGARHRELYSANGLNLWRDLLPERVRVFLESGLAGDRTQIDAGPGDLLPKADKTRQFTIQKKQFDEKRLGAAVGPRKGRFYPKGLLKGFPQIFPQNIEPFRCTTVENGHIGVDFNHPLTGRSATLELVVDSVRAKTGERGGASRVWIEELTAGPGMQARCGDQPTDFFSGDPFRRQDEEDDGMFYRQPRMVQHIDDTAIGVIGQIYGQHLAPGMRVLDLMSSWQSHVPAGAGLSALTGLGMNKEELAANPQLTETVVHDLNRDPSLPFAADHFDGAVCTVSVEYLTRPGEVFQELARVLRPGAPLLVTFSDRWFPPKAIRIWSQLHEFERLGLVSEYFRQAGGFQNLETVSVRGLPRPVDDKYFPERIFSDPVFAVIGKKEM